jgi:hypothetical protein
MKLWAVAYPKNPLDNSSTKVWTAKHLDIRNLDLTQYRVEIMILLPGDLLLSIGLYSTAHG